MKASELIYRLARAIEERGDLQVTVAVAVCGDEDTTLEGDALSLDVNTNTYGFEIYGQVKQ